MTFILQFVKRGLILASLGVFVACGGGGGTNATTGGAGTNTVAAPPAQTTVQSSVLRAGVKQITNELTQTNVASVFTASYSTDWSIGQVFVYSAKAYKISGIDIALDRSSLTIYTTTPSSDEVYSSLKYSYTMHPVLYNSDGSVQKAAQSGLARALRSALAIPLADNGDNKTTDLSCLIPKGEITAGADEWGLKYSMDCTLSQLLLNTNGLFYKSTARAQ